MNTKDQFNRYTKEDLSSDQLEMYIQEDKDIRDLVIELREEMFNDTRFGAEVFYMHVRGVDTLFVLSYMHILKKSVY